MKKPLWAYQQRLLPFKICLSPAKQTNTSSHFSSQYLHPPLHHPSCYVLDPLTWSSSLTRTLSWETAPLSGKRLSTVPVSLRGQRCTQSTWSPISSGTWIRTLSTTWVCCWLGLERGGLARRARRLWAGLSVQVSWHAVHTRLNCRSNIRFHCLTFQQLKWHFKRNNCCDRWWLYWLH